MIELQITESGSKPTKLLGDGKKKLAYVVGASAALVIDQSVYKINVKIVGPDKDGAEEILGTVKLAETINAEFTPETPE